MTHLAVHEWGRVNVGTGPDSFSRRVADQLIASARLHRLGGIEGTNILSDHHRYLRARQCVGVLASMGGSLEILPKVDPKGPSAESSTVRAQLVRMVDAALNLNISEGEITPLARQSYNLLEILVRIFADRLFAQVRHGLPRVYRENTGDLPVLRGKLDIARQFTFHSVRPDRLACRFDELSVDTPLLRIMRASVSLLLKIARTDETRNLLSKLRILMADVSEVPIDQLPWTLVKIDRSNLRWRALFEMAKLLLNKEWQATHHDSPNAQNGISLLFPMNDLFEATVASTLRHALARYDLDVVTQGGARFCLGEWDAKGPCRGTIFQTRPDIIIRSRRRVVAIIDTKWKCLRDISEQRGRGISQADVYQMMAYSQVYCCDRVLLLYPHHSGLLRTGIQASYGIAIPKRALQDRLQVATVEVGQPTNLMAEALRAMVLQMIERAS